MHSTGTVKNVARREYKKNPNRRLSAIWREIRKRRDCSLLGDYPILASIIITAGSLQIKLTRNEINYALNQSTELKLMSKSEKGSLLNQLSDLCSGAMK